MLILPVAVVVPSIYSPLSANVHEGNYIITAVPLFSRNWLHSGRKTNKNQWISSQGNKLNCQNLRIFFKIRASELLLRGQSLTPSAKSSLLRVSERWRWHQAVYLIQHRLMREKTGERCDRAEEGSIFTLRVTGFTALQVTTWMVLHQTSLRGLN